MKIAIAFCCLLFSVECSADAAEPSQGEWVLKLAAEYFAPDEQAKEIKVDPLVFSRAAFAQGYFQGTFEVFRSSGVYSPPPRTTFNQTVAVIQKYVREHPKDWQKFGVELIGDALIDAWPGPNAEKYKAFRGQ
jgi:hypothetical protein